MVCNYTGENMLFFLSFTGKNITFGSTLLPYISQYFTDLYEVDTSFNRSVTEYHVHHSVSYNYITEYVFYTSKNYLGQTAKYKFIIIHKITSSCNIVYLFLNS